MGRKTDPLKKAQNKSRKIEIKAKLASDALDREKYGMCQVGGCSHIARVIDDGMNVCKLHTKEAIAAHYEKGREAWDNLQAMMGAFTEGQDMNIFPPKG